jgi:acetolactate synthase-1/2/3 large subunit
MIVAEAVGRALVREGVDHVFGVVGSGNFHATNAMIAAGARFVAARHEGGAATMADAFSRISGRLSVVSVHQGPGLTNAMTGITEAAKSRTPLVIMAAEATRPGSNFYVDQRALAEAVGAVSERVTSAETAVDDAVRAIRRARSERRTVLLNLPLDVQAVDCPDDLSAMAPYTALPPSAPDAADVTALAELLGRSEHPVFIAGRGARAARAELEALADACGALLATSAVAKGLFHGNPWSLDVSGGFASPLAAELITAADLIIGWGCTLNMWTTRHGKLIGPGATVVQVDLDQSALGANRPIDLGIVGDVAATASAVRLALVDVRPASVEVRAKRASKPRETLREQIAREVSWASVPYADDSGDGRIDPRTFTLELDRLLPAERVVAVDSGNFMGYPSMFLSVPDERGFCSTQAFQSIGLGLATAIGAALAQPDRLPVAALGDGGALMSIAELETVVRLRLPMVIAVYDDEAYGAEVHHFGPDGYPLDTVQFPSVDIAAIGRGFGCDGVTVRTPGDLTAVRTWLDGPRNCPLIIDAKITRNRGSWWLEEAFGH